MLLVLESRGDEIFGEDVEMEVLHAHEGKVKKTDGRDVSREVSFAFLLTSSVLPFSLSFPLLLPLSLQASFQKSSLTFILGTA